MDDARERKSILIPLLVLAVIKVVLHVATDQQYGFHRDELATLDDARHLAWGFVAYPPLTPFLARIEWELFGPNPALFRLFPAIAQSIAIVLAAMMARRMGGSTRAQWMTALAVAIAPISLGASSLMQYVSFDSLWWVLIAYFVVRLIQSDDPRWWVAVGATIGLGVLTKYTIAFFVAGLVAGVLLTPLRRHLASRWLWIGVAVSLLIALPNLLWQWQHHFISLEFLQFIHARDVRIGRTDGFFKQQFLTSANPITAPLWIAGLIALFASPRLRRFRILGWMAVVPFALFVLAKGRGYYTGPLFPMLLAAGAVELANLFDRWPMRRARLAYGAVMLVFALFSGVALLVLPVWPLGSRQANRAMANNHDLAEEVGWPELTAEVARIWQTIPTADRANAAIFANNYGEAGALNLYGPRYGLPEALSGINSYWDRGWGSGNPAPETVIVLGDQAKDLAPHCQSITLAGRASNRWGVHNEETDDYEGIYLCHGFKHRWPDIWKELRSFG